MRTIRIPALAFALLAVALASCGPRDYPLRTCVICDHALGERGGPLVFVYKGQKVEVCGEGHRAEFLKDPARYLAKIKEAQVL